MKETRMPMFKVFGTEPIFNPLFPEKQTDHHILPVQNNEYRQAGNNILRFWHLAKDFNPQFPEKQNKPKNSRKVRGGGRDFFPSFNEFFSGFVRLKQEFWKTGRCTRSLVARSPDVWADVLVRSLSHDYCAKKAEWSDHTAVVVLW